MVTNTLSKPRTDSSGSRIAHFQPDRTTEEGSDLNMRTTLEVTYTIRRKEIVPHVEPVPTTGPELGELCRGLRRTYNQTSRTVSFRRWLKESGASRSQVRRIVDYLNHTTRTAPKR